MKKSLIATNFLFLLGMIFMVQMAVAVPLPQYRVNDNFNPVFSFNGGPFDVTPLPSGTPFPTFCIEISEQFNPGYTYWGSIENSAIFGGNGAVAGKDLLDNKTKVLYSYFLDNPSLDPYKKVALQLAVWRIEQEVDANYNGYALSAGNNYSGLSYYSTDGKTIIGWADYYFSDAFSGGTPKYEIMVLNLWSKAYNVGDTYETAYKKQSMLIKVPEPGILILLGIALSAIGLVARRFKF